MSGENGWIGVDLDGCLAQYDGWKGIEHIGNPVPLMLERVKAWIANDRDVRIFTARVCESEDQDKDLAKTIIEAWCKEHIGKILPVTNIKDFSMIELWDDRCFQVCRNAGTLLTDELRQTLKQQIDYYQAEEDKWAEGRNWEDAAKCKYMRLALSEIWTQFVGPTDPI